MNKRRIIDQLRAKADSTTFPEEAKSLRERADKLEAKYFGAGQPKHGDYPDGFEPLVLRTPRRGRSLKIEDMQKICDDMNAGRKPRMYVNGKEVVH